MKEILENCYNNIADKDISVQSELYYSIIQIKKENLEFYNFYESIYIDIKKFIKCYFDSVEEKDHGYDFIDTEKVINSIEVESSADARFELYSFTIRLLKAKNQDELLGDIYKKRLLTKFEVILNKKTSVKYLEAIFFITSYNILSIALTLFLLSLVGLLIMQTSPLDCFALLRFEYEKFDQIEIVNQFLNIIAKPLGLAEKFKIIPLNIYGVLLLIFFKIIYIAIVINFMFEKVKDNLIR